MLCKCKDQCLGRESFECRGRILRASSHIDELWVSVRHSVSVNKVEVLEEDSWYQPFWRVFTQKKKKGDRKLSWNCLGSSSLSWEGLGDTKSSGEFFTKLRLDSNHRSYCVDSNTGYVWTSQQPCKLVLLSLWPLEMTEWRFWCVQQHIKGVEPRLKRMCHICNWNLGQPGAGALTFNYNAILLHSQFCDVTKRTILPNL